VHWFWGHHRYVGSRTFHVSTTVSVSPGRAIDFLMDLGSHRGLHPFLVSAEIVSEGSGPDGPWWDWKVHERPPLGPWHYSVRFPAYLVRTGPAAMRSRVRAAPGCRLESTTEGVAVDSGTRLVEQTVVFAPPLLLSYVERQARAAHTRTYERLPAELSVGF
jgi:hypothetical protein